MALLLIQPRINQITIRNLLNSFFGKTPPATADQGDLLNRDVRILFLQRKVHSCHPRLILKRPRDTMMVCTTISVDGAAICYHGPFNNTIVRHGSPRSSSTDTVLGE